MRALDVYWRSNREWYEIKDCRPVIKENAPKEAKESFKRYVEQLKQK